MAKKSQWLRLVGEQDARAGKSIDAFYAIPKRASGFVVRHGESERASYEIGYRAAKDEMRKDKSQTPMIDLSKVRNVEMSCVEFDDGIQRAFSMGYPMIHTDAGRSQSRRPKQKNDCTVRAVTTVLDKPYDEIYDMLAAAGRKCTRGFDIVKWLKQQPWAEKIAFPAVKGQPRMNPATFCNQFTEGRYICRASHHVFAVVDGVLFDTFENRPNRCIYTAWRIR